MTTDSIISKVWSFCHTLRDDGVGYGDYLVTCLGVIPLALICGALREIPVFWRLIDCSFGVFGALPLLYCHHVERQIAQG